MVLALFMRVATSPGVFTRYLKYGPSGSDVWDCNWKETFNVDDRLSIWEINRVLVEFELLDQDGGSFERLDLSRDPTDGNTGSEYNYDPFENDGGRDLTITYDPFTGSWSGGDNYHDT